MNPENGALSLRNENSTLHSADPIDEGEKVDETPLKSD